MAVGKHLIRTGIFGGSFNPIHNAHIALARKIKQLAALDEVWFVVSPHNPLKDAEGLMPDDLRLQMVAEALKGEEGLAASDYEFHLPRPSYMLHTLQGMSRDYPEREFSLIIGADNWLCFDRWFGYKDILAGYNIYVYPRQGSKVDASAMPPNVELLNTGLYNLSSTQIRQMIKNGKPIDRLVPPCVVSRLGLLAGLKL